MAGVPGAAPDSDRRGNSRRLMHMRTGSTNSASSTSLHRSVIPECCEMEDEGVEAHMLSMHSVRSTASHAAGADASEDSLVMEGSRHGPADACILPPPPQLPLDAGVGEGAPQHAQHASAGAQPQEFQTELAEVMSMLRMVTERVSDLHRTRQPHV